MTLTFGASLSKFLKVKSGILSRILIDLNLVTETLKAYKDFNLYSQKDVAVSQFQRA